MMSRSACTVSVGDGRSSFLLISRDSRSAWNLPLVGKRGCARVRWRGGLPDAPSEKGSGVLNIWYFAWGLSGASFETCRGAEWRRRLGERPRPQEVSSTEASRLRRRRVGRLRRRVLTFGRNSAKGLLPLCSRRRLGFRRRAYRGIVSGYPGVYGYCFAAAPKVNQNQNVLHPPQKHTTTPRKVNCPATPPGGTIGVRHRGGGLGTPLYHLILQ